MILGVRPRMSVINVKLVTLMPLALRLDAEIKNVHYALMLPHASLA